MRRYIACGDAEGRPEWTPCCWPGCEKLAEGGGPPLCERHYIQIGLRFLREHGARYAEIMRQTVTADHVHAEMRRINRDALAHRARRRAAYDERSQVYYIRIHDHVKIGYTVNLRQRLIQLRVDDDAVLATEPGGRELERQRHREFAAERVSRREDFNPSRRLLAHIESVKQEHGDPNITGYFYVP